MDAGIEPGTAALQTGATLALSRLSHHIHSLLCTVYCGRRMIQLEAPPAGSTFALVGVQPAAAAPAAESSTQSSSLSALHLHSSNGTGSSTTSAHLSSPADAWRLLPVGDRPLAGQPATAVLAAVAPAYH
jgi:hypothetical protein